MITKDFVCKQFRVGQENTALKIGTDAFVLGAYTHHFKNTTILDIGTGTGILALMLAQKYSEAHIHAVEINAQACIDAHYNFSRSAWHKNLSCIHADIATYTQNCTTKYDIIISNPPFFHNSLPSKNDALRIAKHSDSLSPTLLLECVSKLVSEQGIVSVIIPFADTTRYISLAETHNLHLIEELQIHPFLNSPPNRSVLIFSKKNTICKQEHLYIRDENKNYTKEYSHLMKDYLLKF
ncbi:MAG: methyltransferase [Bacteroidales bacterium]|jgi:tRNA1Val (adenine37-N6)-methyltransferase|nr:methyltransferase [Bacteroidales bacterium]NLK81940.1 methyltransferase [Bacteroidales bacterium]HPY82416.1 methyltransferase [Bacteroidales bacterium]